MIPLSVPEIEGGSPERYGEGAKVGLVLEYSRRLDIEYWVLGYIHICTHIYILRMEDEVILHGQSS